MDLALKNQSEGAAYEGKLIQGKKMTLWLGMASMTMLFAALTSALVVKKGDAQTWEAFQLPSSFMISTLLVVATSILLHFALQRFNQAKFRAYRWLMFGGFLTGVGFLLAQWFSWVSLMNINVMIDGNPSGSFIYAISGMHGLHILGGLVILGIVLIKAYRSRKSDEINELKNIIDPKRKLSVELLVTYWHFVDFLWVYLFLFFFFTYR